MSSPAIQKDNMECPLCLGQGQLTRAEVLERLGMKDFARIAQLSAEEAFRLLLKEHKQEENSLWLRFEGELTKRINDVTQRHKNEIQALQTTKAALQLRIAEFEKNQDAVVQNAKQSERLEAEKALQLPYRGPEYTNQRSRSQNLEMEMSKVARVGKKEEVSFAEEAQTWPGIWLSEKFKKHGDYLLAFRDLSGQPLDPKLLIDNEG